ncbi:hypothetical protein ACN28S_14100 [Cystobacter fuscus]
MISGATELGRHFDDYASCDRVRTQRPYYAVPPAPNAEREDPRMKDPAYAAEVAWVRTQIESTACVCCHSTRAPKGTSNWYVESPGNFINSFNPRGLAMGAGWINTVGFGAYPREHNNGFSRASPERPLDSIFVTTDPDRMARFFQSELFQRGFKREDFADQPYGAGPLDDQRLFRPTACAKGEGVDARGLLQWRGARPATCTSSSRRARHRRYRPTSTCPRARSGGSTRPRREPGSTVERCATEPSPPACRSASRRGGSRRR